MAVGPSGIVDQISVEPKIWADRLANKSLRKRCSENSLCPVFVSLRWQGAKGLEGLGLLPLFLLLKAKR